MDKPVFNNKENIPYIVENKTIWESRSMAVHGMLIVVVNGIPNFLLAVRSENCPDEVGKFANVTGYLDWDETLFESLKREYWEEVNLNFDKYFSKENLIFGSLDPHKINDDPKSSRQNVTVRYRFAFELEKFPKVYPSKEAQSVSFLDINYLKEKCEVSPESFAWNHAELILEFINDFQAEFNKK